MSDKNACYELNEWIPMDFKAPPEGVEVLVCTKAGSVYLGRRYADHWSISYSPSRGMKIEPAERAIGILYWQHTPEPPKLVEGFSDEALRDIDELFGAKNAERVG